MKKIHIRRFELFSMIFFCLSHSLTLCHALCDCVVVLLFCVPGIIVKSKLHKITHVICLFLVESLSFPLHTQPLLQRFAIRQCALYSILLRFY